jgi:hypothetical protein
MLTFRNWLADDKRLEKSIGWISGLMILIAALPSVFILLWGIYVYKNINHLLGFAIFLVLMALQLTSYAFFHWKVNGWRLDRLVKVLFFLAILAMWAFEIWTIYLKDVPYTYFNLSVVWISFNMLPMVVLTYLVVRKWAKAVEQYEELDTDPVADYKTYLAEIMEAQNVKVGQPIERPQGGSEMTRSAGAVRIHLPVEKAGASAGPSDDEKKEQRIDVKPSSTPNATPGGQTPHSPHAAVLAFHNFSDKIGIRRATDYAATIWKEVLCYFAAFALLIVYALSVQLIKSSDGFGNQVGWITMGTIMVLDLTVWLCVYGGKISSPLTACLYQGAGRIILVIFGDIYWSVFTQR